MTHDELLAKIEHFRNVPFDPLIDALRAVVELHKPYTTLEKLQFCVLCAHYPDESYPCETIQVIEKELV